MPLHAHAHPGHVHANETVDAVAQDDDMDDDLDDILRDTSEEETVKDEKNSLRSGDVDDKVLR